MTEMILFNSSGEILFIILVLIPIVFYLLWKIGYNLFKVRIFILISVAGAFCLFFIITNFTFFIEQSLKVIIRNLLFFNLIFFSTTFTLIILVVPSDQNIDNKSQSTEFQDNTTFLTESLDQNNDETTMTSPDIDNRHKEQIYFSEDRQENRMIVSDKESANDDFQKLINDLFEIQNKK